MALDTTGLPQPLANAAQAIYVVDQAAGTAFVAAYNNQQTLAGRATAALTANTAFLALAAPTNAQTLAQVQALTRECTALIRLAVGLLDTTAGT